MCISALLYVLKYIYILLETFITLLKKKIPNEKNIAFMSKSVASFFAKYFLVLKRGSKFIHVYELLYFELN